MIADSGYNRFFFYYRDIAGAIYPVLEDTHHFERVVDLLLQRRASSGGMYRADPTQAQRPFGVSIAFMGLLFSVLASGCQSSDLPSKERELTSQVYGMLLKYPGPWAIAYCISVLFVPMSTDDQLFVTADGGSYSNAFNYRECAIL